jgi:tripartite-type tricarboxylate transporter receptor subunit TctC
MLTQGMEPIGNTPGEFSKHVQSEIGKWARIVKASGAKAE